MAGLRLVHRRVSRRAVHACGILHASRGLRSLHRSSGGDLESALAQWTDGVARSSWLRVSARTRSSGFRLDFLRGRPDRPRSRPPRRRQRIPPHVATSAGISTAVATVSCLPHSPSCEATPLYGPDVQIRNFTSATGFHDYSHCLFLPI